ncbi:MAG: DUF2961 domain-containing protein [Puia sp.]|nr:DUF2961 domain-containing protein [Puia sp.]
MRKINWLSVALSVYILAHAGEVAAQNPDKESSLKNPALVWEDLPRLRPGVQIWSHTSKNPFNRTVQDFLNYTARDGKDFEMANFKGRSGMLIHDWFAFLDKDDPGTLKLYDGSAVAARYSGAFAGYFNTGHYPHLLWETRDKIWWGFPGMPFRGQFKATSGAPPEWYQLTLHLYREDRFSEQLTKTDLEEILRKMQQPPGTFPGAVPGNRQDRGEILLATDGPKKIFSVGQPGVIRQFRLELPALKDSAAFDSLYIRITTDGKLTACLPLPFFFGGYAGTDRNNARGLPAGFDGRYFYNFFPMPFQASFSIELENRNSGGVRNPIDIRYRVDWSDQNPYPRATTGVFTVQYNPPTPVAAGQPDFTNLSVKGSGVMVGAVSKLTGAIEANFSIFVDGSHTPAIESTGGEDYFNHSYGIHPGFTRPFSGGLAKDIGYRFHIIDYIPFSNSLLFTQDHAEYQAHDRDGIFNSAVFYYMNPNPCLSLTDRLDVGDSGSETAHGYHCKGSVTRLATDTAFYEGAYSDPLVDAGRWTNGESRFTVIVDPHNDGVRIRKRIDQTAYHQALRVYVDGEPAGEWFEQGANYHLNKRLYYSDTLPDWGKGNLHARFRDTEFEIPARLTRGKTTLSIRIQTIGSLAVDPREAGLTNEYYYWIYSYRSVTD